MNESLRKNQSEWQKKVQGYEAEVKELKESKDREVTELQVHSFRAIEQFQDLFIVFSFLIFLEHIFVFDANCKLQPFFCCAKTDMYFYFRSKSVILCSSWRPRRR